MQWRLKQSWLEGNVIKLTLPLRIPQLFQAFSGDFVCSCASWISARLQQQQLAFTTCNVQ
jgi:hypothetical protein